MVNPKSSANPSAGGKKKKKEEVPSQALVDERLEDSVTKTFQIRTKPETHAMAERLAADHSTKRSKLDGIIYERGLLLEALLLGPGPDGTYAGLSRRELAQRLKTMFPNQFQLLDEEELLPSMYYRILPPGSELHREPATQPVLSREQPSTQGEEKGGHLSQSAAQAITNLPEEI